jgi:uncharacterized tellurite resistance protein B-like protein
MEQRDLFRNLVIMAVCDNSLAQSEIELLQKRAGRWDISDNEFAKIIEYALSPECEVTIPSDYGDRLTMARDMLLMMAADGYLARAEKRIFAVAAAAMDFGEDEVNALIDDTLENPEGELP